MPNWQQTDGVVTVTMPDQPPIEVRMTDRRDNVRLCGVVLLENAGGTLKAAASSTNSKTSANSTDPSGGLCNGAPAARIDRTS